MKKRVLVKHLPEGSEEMSNKTYEGYDKKEGGPLKWGEEERRPEGRKEMTYVRGKPNIEAKTRKKKKPIIKWRGKKKQSAERELKEGNNAEK